MGLRAYKRKGRGPRRRTAGATGLIPRPVKPGKTKYATGLIPPPVIPFGVIKPVTGYIPPPVKPVKIKPVTEYATGLIPWEIEGRTLKPVTKYATGLIPPPFPIGPGAKSVPQKVSGSSGLDVAVYPPTGVKRAARRVPGTTLEGLGSIRFGGLDRDGNLGTAGFVGTGQGR